MVSVKVHLYFLLPARPELTAVHIATVPHLHGKHLPPRSRKDLHFPDEETEAQRTQMTYPRSEGPSRI